MNVFSCKVFFEDTDAAQVVYHANYLKYCDRARTEWLRSLGVNFDQLLREEGTTFVVANATMDFIKPGRLGDELEVHSSVKSAGFAETVFSQLVVRPETGDTLCAVTVRCAYVKGPGYRPVKMPAQLRKLLKQEERKP